MKKTKCNKCNNYFSNKGGNYNKHIKVCDGNYTIHTKLDNCKYCNLSFEKFSGSQIANHSRWCENNPNKKSYIENLISIRESIPKKSRILVGQKVKKLHAEGHYQKVYDAKRGKTGHKHTEETKEILRKKALSSKHRRLRRNIQIYKNVMMDSSWEVELAKRLDEQNIKWIRPEPLIWIDENGIKHNYFSDFYLPEHDIYIDPKNSHAMKVQKKKLDKLFEMYDNIIILSTLEQCKTYKIE